MMVVVLLAWIVAPTTAEPVTDTFYALESAQEGWSGGGSGYDDGHWYTWDEPTWFARVQWFNNEPFIPENYKTIYIEFDIDRLDPAEGEGDFQLWVNWTTPEWSALGLDRPPLPDQGEVGYLVHSPMLLDTIYFTSPLHIELDYVIEDYNPEWVSIDAYGHNFDLTNGIIIHECVPEPGTLALLAFGMLAVLRRR